MIRSRTKRKPSVLRPLARKNRTTDKRSWDFMEFVTRFPCCITRKDQWDDFLTEKAETYRCFLTYADFQNDAPREFAHIGGGMAAKASNYHGIPLTKWHHTGHSTSKFNHHCEHALKADFAEFHNIPMEAIIDRLYECFCLYEKETQ